ncbi:CDP-glucose 4,6-dehydratase [Runella zeae]|uniref:CDP-glucose 4,6-dehydratase n=1 Tax=Runella zeae TaxID=94255 RepID=UPI00042A308E|nr:CDP-glucose 4,6-dehydratase [Runella zeae]
MESMVNLFGGQYKQKKVLITGHTGFKGSWLSYWLQNLGAQLTGYSLSLPTTPNHFELIRPEIDSYEGDIRDYESFLKVVTAINPDIIFHLAAQPLVRRSYSFPLETFSTNVLGTANVLEAARHCSNLKAIINVTSDKCYENSEHNLAFKETDAMGGHDPYSASKGCAELVAASFRKSFYGGKILMASVRAGNVIGGGDWATDRLIPDIVKATIESKSVEIRYPKATRPWQHVLEPLSGYLSVGQKLLEGAQTASDSWNFGPNDGEALSVDAVLKIGKSIWPAISYTILSQEGIPHEANFLRLDCSKANMALEWYPVWNTHQAIKKTFEWYKAFYFDQQLLTHDDLTNYISDAITAKLLWTQ